MSKVSLLDYQLFCVQPQNLSFGNKFQCRKFATCNNLIALGYENCPSRIFYDRRGEKSKSQLCSEEVTESKLIKRPFNPFFI